MINPTNPDHSSSERSLDALQTYTTMMSPIQAQHILATQMWPRQRSIRPAHVSYLESAISLGQLTTLTLIFAKLPDGNLQLIDGQHRLHALVNITATLPCTVIIHSVVDHDAIGRLYLTIDRQTTREAKDGLRAVGIEQRTRLSMSILQRIAGGAVIVDMDFSRSYRQKVKSLTYRMEVVERWLPEGERYAALLEGASQEVSGKLWRAPVCAVALATLRESSLADDFWGRMALEDGLARNDPRARLLAWLRANQIRQVASDIVYARHVAGAWNAYHEGRTLDRLQIKDPSAPVRILGTRFATGSVA